MLSVMHMSWQRGVRPRLRAAILLARGRAPVCTVHLSLFAAACALSQVTRQAQSFSPTSHGG